MAGAGRNLADVVRLEPELQLGPHRLHGGGDDRVLLLLEHVGHGLRQLRGLHFQPRQLVARLCDLQLELRHRLLLLRLQGTQLRKLRVELVALSYLLVASGLLQLT